MIVALLHTSEYRGDHHADVCRWFEVAPGETVAALVARLLPPGASRYDSIEIRPAEPSPGAPHD